MEKRKNQKQKEKMRKEKEAMIFRGGKKKRKRLRGGKMKNRCRKDNEKEYGMQKTVMLRKDRKQKKR